MEVISVLGLLGLLATIFLGLRWAWRLERRAAQRISAAMDAESAHQAERRAASWAVVEAAVDRKKRYRALRRELQESAAGSDEEARVVVMLDKMDLTHEEWRELTDYDPMVNCSTSRLRALRDHLSSRALAALEAKG